MQPVAQVAHPDETVAFAAFCTLVKPALRAAARNPLRRARHAGRACQAPTGRGWCADCEATADDLLTDSFRRLRKALHGPVPTTRNGEPVREWLVLRTHLTSPEAEQQDAADLAADLTRPTTDTDPRWLRAARAQLVHYPLRHLEGRVRRQDAVARGAAARPERDLRQARWAAPLRTDPSLLDLAIIAVFRARRGLTDLLHVPEDVRQRLNLTPAQATEKMRKALQTLHTINPAFLPATLGSSALSLPPPAPTTPPAAPPATPPERIQAQSTLRALLTSHPHRPIIAALCALAAGENTAPTEIARRSLGLSPEAAYHLVRRLTTLIATAGIDWTEQLLTPAENHPGDGSTTPFRRRNDHQAA